MISNGLELFGGPEIMAAGDDSSFIGKSFRGFHTACNIVSQTVIQGLSSKFRDDGTYTRFVSINY